MDSEDRKQGHFEGFTESQIKTLFNYFERLEKSVEKIEKDLQSLNSWKAQTIGGAIAASGLVSFLVTLLK